MILKKIIINCQQIIKIKYTLLGDKMLLSELQNKDIISTTTGDNLGRIIDVEIDFNGKIQNIYAEEKKMIRSYFKNNELKFKYEDIVKIGTDVILVKI